MTAKPQIAPRLAPKVASPDAGSPARTGPSAPTPRTGRSGAAPGPLPSPTKVSPTTASPTRASATEDALRLLLAIEDRVRAAESEGEFIHLIANETRKLVQARQIFVLRAGRSGRFTVEAVSSLALVDRETPLIRWIEASVARLHTTHDPAKSASFDIAEIADAGSGEAKSYPFAHMHWQPLVLKSGAAVAGLLLARERPWVEADTQVLAREAEVFVSNWQSLFGAGKLAPTGTGRRWLKPVLAGVLALACVLPVSMTTLAPVEIVASDPHGVTAPIDGVIKQVLVEPNRPVKAGQPVLRFDDTTLRNQFKIADRQMQVAEARYDRAQQAAFGDEAARHELAIALNEYRLKRAERTFAAAQLAKATVYAARDGILIYSDKHKLIGHPVKTGQRLMQITDPNDIAARIDVPVADAIVLEKGAFVRIFLDADPLRSATASLKSTSYHAEPNATQQLVYKLYARFDRRRPTMRIGARGTAQLHGDRVPLIYFLLRRPISALRQYLGL